MKKIILILSLFIVLFSTESFSQRWSRDYFLGLWNSNFDDASETLSRNYLFLKDTLDYYIQDVNGNYLLPRDHIFPQYTLTVVVNGYGTVTKSPSQSLYDSNTVVTLWGKNKDTYGDLAFESWSGDLSGTDSITTIVMNSNKIVYANFPVMPTRFAFNKYVYSNGGTISTVPNRPTIDSGTAVIVSAIPNSSYSFKKLAGFTSASVVLGNDLYTAYGGHEEVWDSLYQTYSAVDTIIMDTVKNVMASFKKTEPICRVVIVESNSDYPIYIHGNMIKTAVIAGYENRGGTWSDSIYIASTGSYSYGLPYQGGVDTADLLGADIVIRSYTDIISFFKTPDGLLVKNALYGYPTQIFGPPAYQLYAPPPSASYLNTGGDLPVMILPGNGTGVDSNRTGFDIEFWTQTTTVDTTLSSTIGFMAGQMLYMADSLNVSLWTIRYLARETGQAWTPSQGYGKLNMEAIKNAYNPLIDYDALDPYKIEIE